jgi:hypothetical protein
MPTAEHHGGSMPGHATAPPTTALVVLPAAPLGGVTAG